MSHQNVEQPVPEAVERLQAALEPFSRTGEIDPAFLAPDFEMRQASSIVDTAGVFRGREALNDALVELQGSFEEISFEAEEFRMCPDGRVFVSVHVRGRGRGSGMEIDNYIAHIWTLREGQAVRLEVYEERTDALEAVGLSGDASQ